MRSTSSSRQTRQLKHAGCQTVPGAARDAYTARSPARITPSHCRQNTPRNIISHVKNNTFESMLLASFAQHAPQKRLQGQTSVASPLTSKIRVDFAYGLPLYKVASWSIQPLGHNRHGMNIEGALPPFLGGELGPHLAQCCLDQGPPPRHVPSWSIQPFGHNRQGPKIGGSTPFLGRRELDPI